MWPTRRPTGFFEARIVPICRFARFAFQSGYLRRVLSILLLAVFGLTLVSPLLALSPSGESGVPACCRRTGKHHCGMTVAERRQGSERGDRLRAPLELCPYASQATLAAYLKLSLAAATGTVLAAPGNHPGGVIQTASKWRIARDRSRQERGPPCLLPC